MGTMLALPDATDVADLTARPNTCVRCPTREASTEARLAGSAHAVVRTIYPDAGHAFFADYPDSYRKGPAHQLWDQLLDFFGTHLKR
jgi:dienelactone hydrolase